MIDSIVPVGKDCDCGHPLIWLQGVQLCSVYGRHPSGLDLAQYPGDTAIYRRNLNAVHAELVKACMDAPNLARGAVRHRERRALLRAVS